MTTNNANYFLSLFKGGDISLFPSANNNEFNKHKRRYSWKITSTCDNIIDLRWFQFWFRDWYFFQKKQRKPSLFLFNIHGQWDATDRKLYFCLKYVNRKSFFNFLLIHKINISTTTSTDKDYIFMILIISERFQYNVALRFSYQLSPKIIYPAM